MDGHAVQALVMKVGADEQASLAIMCQLQYCSTRQTWCTGNTGLLHMWSVLLHRNKVVS